jgi:hypothetical protein
MIDRLKRPRCFFLCWPHAEATSPMRVCSLSLLPATACVCSLLSLPSPISHGPLRHWTWGYSPLSDPSTPFLLPFCLSLPLSARRHWPCCTRASPPLPASPLDSARPRTVQACLPGLSYMPPFLPRLSLSFSLILSWPCLRVPHSSHLSPTSPQPPYTHAHTRASIGSDSIFAFGPSIRGRPGEKTAETPADTFVGAPPFSQSQKTAPVTRAAGPAMPPPRRPINRPLRILSWYVYTRGHASHRCGLWRRPLPSSPLSPLSSLFSPVDQALRAKRPDAASARAACRGM